MLILRFFLVVVALLLTMNALMYMFTRDRKYVQFAWQILRFSLLFLSVFGALYVLERFVLTGWKVLL